MNVLFTHGYFLREDPKEQAIMKPYPPSGCCTSLPGWIYITLKMKYLTRLFVPKLPYSNTRWSAACASC
ncbi:MAG: hypothetical protein EPGJADBJ_05191 [Saprospiraceae bacterium]|nr:hypothetical protein [Saprospiraceae bacterium]